MDKIKRIKLVGIDEGLINTDLTFTIYKFVNDLNN